ncbi:flavoprotein [Calycomorphotria hydatis]|uniref:Phosphopantothenoylcysteine decarboxylase n=1 Tax=Calycomorphotria hydatis TaxID=2528027 RepID=A0A517TC65_9PLAN|nr:flavoprotein [Calycomorphotria hydatis]QDT65958.1 Phosphopantothenoylcysteine decarboxylase [Calycomorphotria hydatis]
MTDKEILLGVSGGIAAYKAADLCSQLVQSGAKMSVVLTEAATAFIGKTTFEALTNRPVNEGLFTPHEHYRGEHIGLAQRAELFVIAPATADVLFKLAHGAADDLLSTLALAVTCPIVVAPAMNSEMWSKASVQRNVEQIKADGMHIIEPGSGWLSCGQVGAGRMAEPGEIVKTISDFFESK